MLTPKLEWESNGPNAHAYIAEQEIFIGRNDRTGKYMVSVNGKFLPTQYRTVREAKDAAQRVSDAIYKSVQ